MLSLLIDRHIPFVKSSLETFTVKHDGILSAGYLEPEEFTPARVREADALIVRTRTQINRALLESSNVKFIATATIGYDHIDTAYCERNGIAWTACPGCNAQAVCDYIEEALSCVSHIWLTNKPATIGIVGVGNVGSKVAAMARRKGMKVLLNDPPKGLNEDVAKADIITFHTPLTRTGQCPTWHLCNDTFLKKCKPDALIINAARGGVADEQALLDSRHPCIIDCWENEPDINRQLLHSPLTLLASCHIAGYSVEGKRNASRTCLQRLADHFHLPPLWDEKAALKEKCRMPQGDAAPGWLQRLTERMKTEPFDFETSRKQYILR